MNEDKRLEEIYDKTLEIVESYTDGLAKHGPEGLLSMVRSLKHALTQVERTLAEMYIKPFLEESDEVVEKQQGSSRSLPEEQETAT